MNDHFSFARAASSKSAGASHKQISLRPTARSLARQTELPITGHRKRSVPRWMSAGVCSLLLGAQAAVGVDLDLTFLSSNRQALVTLNGGTGEWHRIEASTNLQDWRALTNLCLSNPAVAWLDSGTTNCPNRFYRSLELTPLDLYVATPDTNYSYALSNTIVGAGQTTFVLEMRSQVWLTANEVNRTLWKHWLIIVVPTGVTNPQSLLYIDSGHTGDSAPAGGDGSLTQIALDTKTVVTQLKMVPNEPLMFAGETTNRTEDEIIAYTWDKYLHNTNDTRWPARLPMTKAAVRATDTVTAFCGSAQGGGVNVQSFVVAGASKRGWTTWTTAAVDQRVVAIIPMVIDILNVQTSMVHHYSAYGFWSDAIQDYTNSLIPSWFGTPQMAALMSIEDPYQYRRRLTMPKFIINDTGDEFFLPDSSQFYFADLPGVKYLRYVPNVEHSLGGAYKTIIEPYYQAALSQAPLPQFSWTLQSSNSIRVVTDGTPTEVKLWQATNPNARDFRLYPPEVTVSAWESTPLTDRGGGVYVGTVDVPAQGWTGFFVEMTYPGSGVLPYIFTTQVYVVPDTLPYHYPP